MGIEHRYQELREVCISFALEAKDIISSTTGIIEYRSIEQIIKDAERFFEWITKGK